VDLSIVMSGCMPSIQEYALMIYSQVSAKVPSGK
jgi:hypothetical protein